MNTQVTPRYRYRTLGLLFAATIWFACGDDDTGPADQTGATVEGTVTTFEAQVVKGGFALAWTEGVTVSTGSLSTVTDASGYFRFENFPVGDRVITLEKDLLVATYLLRDVESGERFLLDQIQFSNGQVSTQHTGTWVGTGGSSDPSSQGQVALTMIISQNGNALAGTASIGEPDNTSWNIIGTETGHMASGNMTVTSTNSICASDAEFEGTFVADTLSGTFIEVDPPQDPEDCGAPESGTFRVVKQ